MEILNTYSEFSDILRILAIYTGIGVLVSLFFTVINLIFKEWKTSLISFMIAVICMELFFGICEWGINTEIVYHEVIVSDYNKIDFNKYEIAERKGKIVVLKEIE
jgi:uncharacterized membrane protein